MRVHQLLHDGCSWLPRLALRYHRPLSEMERISPDALQLEIAVVLAEYIRDEARAFDSLPSRARVARIYNARNNHDVIEQMIIELASMTGREGVVCLEPGAGHG